MTKAPKLTKEHGLIDWTRPAAAGVQPDPGHAALADGVHVCPSPQGTPVRLIVVRASRGRSDAGSEEPGPAWCVSSWENRLLRRTGAGDRVEVLELQPAGKRRMAAGDSFAATRLEDRRFGRATS